MRQPHVYVLRLCNTYSPDIQHPAKLSVIYARAVADIKEAALPNAACAIRSRIIGSILTGRFRIALGKTGVERFA